MCSSDLRPFSEIRFLYGGNIGDGYCFGLEQLPPKGDTLFITGGEKDVMTLAAHGFHAICFNSETSTIPPAIIYKLTFRFKHIVLLYDTDKTGMDAAIRPGFFRHHDALVEFERPLPDGGKDQIGGRWIWQGGARDFWPNAERLGFELPPLHRLAASLRERGIGALPSVEGVVSAMEAYLMEAHLAEGVAPPS